MINSCFTDYSSKFNFLKKRVFLKKKLKACLETSNALEWNWRNWRKKNTDSIPFVHFNPLLSKEKAKLQIRAATSRGIDLSRRIKRQIRAATATRTVACAYPDATILRLATRERKRRVNSRRSGRGSRRRRSRFCGSWPGH